VKLVRLLLPIDSGGTTAACTRAAFGLAGRFGAALEILHPCPPPSQRLPYSTELSPLYFEDLSDLARKQADEEERKATDWFERTIAAYPEVRAELLTVEGLVEAAVSLRGKVNDLAVLPSIGARDDEMFSAARDAALFQSGRPVLIVPDEAGEPVFETVVIAWKNSVQAVHAVTAAAPFLEQAKRVRLVSISEDSEEDESTAPMSVYLSLAGLPVETKTILLGDREVGDAILTAAGSGVLLVMGGYGHWRLREWVFGGATMQVLNDTDVAVLMAH
jgi:nucleotide-binding universal stress UspA family protein